MPFNPDSDANYQAFLAARAKLSGPDADVFTDAFIQYMANQCTLAATSNAALITSAITAAKTAVKKQAGIAVTDSNYLAAKSVPAKLSGNDIAESLEHIVKGHAQLASATTVLSGASQTTINANAKTATQAKKHTY